MSGHQIRSSVTAAAKFSIQMKWNMLAVAIKKPDQKQMSDRLTRQKVGDKLKQVYVNIVAEPVPDRFVDLIDQLELAEDSKKSDRKSSHQEDKS